MNPHVSILLFRLAPLPPGVGLGEGFELLQLRCTQKVIKQLGLSPKDLVECKTGDTPLGNWYINMLERRKTLIFMNERTLFSFIIYGIKKSNTANFPEVFYRGLGQALSFEGFDIDTINNVFASYQEYAFTKTNSKKLLGNMNELVALYKHCIYSDGGLEHCDLTKIMMQLNRMPQKNIDWGYSIDAVKSIIEQPIGMN